MRVPLRWLAELVELPTDDPEELASVFASLGHDVEAVEHLPIDFTGVVTARVDEIVPHPEATKVRLCKVSTGADPVDVWCGAWNFEAGAVVAYAPPGAVLAGGAEIGVRPMFGVESRGMICSERELGLGEDHAGIITLDPDTPIGVDFARVVERPEEVIDLEITPNRPDAMSLVGLARELAAYYRTEVRLPPTEVEEAGETTGVAIRIDDPTGCYRFNGREVRGVTVGTAPFALRQRLRAAGIRSISNIVDVSNYVMLELGQPLHIFDLDRVAGETVIARRAREGEELTTLDGVIRRLDPEDMVVADAERAIALAGTMGGADSEVTPHTNRVLIEGAAWDPATIMYMSRRHALRSEASARFERGVDPELGPKAVARAARLVTELAGGKALQGAVDVVAVPVEPAVIELRVEDVTRVLGEGFDHSLIAELLGRLHLEVTGADPMRVTVPTFRRDLARPIDLVEEVARLHGYERFGETVPLGRAGAWSDEQLRRQRVRSILVGAGLSQIVPLSFMRLGDLDTLAIPSDDERRRTVRVRNPLREEESVLRTTLIPGLIHAARYNLSHGASSVALFDTGLVYLDRPSPRYQRLPDQPDRVGFLMLGPFGLGGIGDPGRQPDVYTSTAIWRLLTRKLDLPEHRLEPASPPGYHPGRTARVLLDGHELGFVGELHPAAARAYDLPGRVAIGELDLDPIAAPRPPWQFEEPSSYPRVTFDLAFEVDEEVAAADLLAVVTEAGGGLVESVRVFDEFRGSGLGPGRKSLALNIALRAPDRTFTSDEAAPLRRSMAEAAAARLGAVLRGSV